MNLNACNPKKSTEDFSPLKTRNIGTFIHQTQTKAQALFIFILKKHMNFSHLIYLYI